MQTLELTLKLKMQNKILYKCKKYKKSVVFTSTLFLVSNYGIKNYN